MTLSTSCPDGVVQDARQRTSQSHRSRPSLRRTHDIDLDRARGSHLCTVNGPVDQSGEVDALDVVLGRVDQHRLDELGHPTSLAFDQIHLSSVVPTLGPREEQNGGQRLPQVVQQCSDGVDLSTRDRARVVLN
ncbi:hypothetical protein [Pedococcus aerophilus]|uniref:hypothetical protein n=1 Tax=Pedococcus aerophilus TaxID=436356 RepID=UPI0031DA74C6